MKYYFFALTMTIALFNANIILSQNFEWAAQTDGLSGEQGKKICIDGKGNVYTSGSSKGNVVLKNHAIAQGDFVAKFSGAGSCLWAKNISGNIVDIESDTYGNLYITGTFTGSVTFGQASLSSSGSKDIYIVKLDANGTALWANKAGSKNDEDPIAMCVDKAGNIYMTGSFSDTISFDTIQLVNEGAYNVFFTKYAGTGSAVWSKQAFTVSNPIYYPYLQPFDILIDSSRIIWTGGYHGEIQIGDTTFESNYTSVFFVTYSPAGAQIKSKNIGYNKGTFIEGAFKDDLHYLYWSGNTGSQYGHYEIIYKHDSLMNITWNASLCHPNWCSTSVKAAGTDKDENLYAVCNYTDFDTYVYGSTGTKLPSNGLTDFFLIKYNPSGTMLWKSNFGNKGDDVCENMVVDSFGSCYITGYLTDTLKLDSLKLYSNNNISHFFVAKFSNGNNLMASMPSQDNYADKMIVYPNPTSGKFSIETTIPWENTEICIFDLFGINIYHQGVTSPEDFQIDLSRHSKGVYFVEVANSEKRISKKIILQ